MTGRLRAALASLWLLSACHGAPQDASPAPTQEQEQASTERASLASDRAVGLRDPATGAWTGNLAGLRTRAEKLGHVRVIVGLRTPFTPEGDLSVTDRDAQRRGIVATRKRVVDAVAGTQSDVVGEFDTIPYVSLRATTAGVAALLRSADVISLHEDVPMAPTLAQSGPLVGAVAAATAGYSGSGQAVAILDSGVETTHAFLTGKTVSEACYSTTDASYPSVSVCPGAVASSTAAGSGANCPSSVNGCAHGTHVAGIATGKGTSFSGMARDANLIPIQVFSKFTTTAMCGVGYAPCILSYNTDQLKGLDRVYALVQAGTTIASVNMSLGGNASTTNCDADPLKASIDNLRSVGVATVIASGNDGFTNSINAPACISTAISVGATTKLDVVDTYSDSASFLSLLAPGTAITSSVPSGAYAAFAGTSMAAPHVAGAWAVLKSKKPTMTVTEGLAVLQSTGLAITDSRNSIVKKRIKIDSALNALRAEPPVFTLSTDTYNTPQTVTITSATSGATLWYTTDGSTPVNGSSSSTPNGSGFNVLGTFTLKAIASKATFVDSTVTSATYTFVALPPTFSPPAGEYGSPQTVTLSDASPGVTLRYTTDGSTPTAATTTTTSSGGTLSVGATTTLKALATRAAWTDSSVTSALYTISGGVSATLGPAAAVSQGARWRRTTSAPDTFEEGSLSRFTYTGGGTGSWAADTSSVSGGRYAARSPAITDNQTSSISTTIECDGSAMAFALHTSTQSGGDFLRFLIDGTVQQTWSGETAWTTTSFPVTAGTHTFAWEYRKNGTGASGSDAVWIDSVVFPGDEWRASGTTAVGLTSASTTVRFKDLAAWITPADQTVSVVPGSTVAVSATYVQRQVATPTFSPVAGTYTTAQAITIASTTAGAAFRYTTDGSTPTGSSTLYTGPITVPLDTTQTIKAIATKTDWLDSAVGSSTYVITGTVATPTFSPTPGTYTSTQNVTISSTTAGAVIHYTTDGSTPTALSTIYTGALNIPLDTTRTLKAIATKTDWVDSGVASGTWTITGTVATPTLSPTPGTFTTAQSVTLSTATAGAVIHYTTDGSTPTGSSAVYSAAISVPLDTTKTIKAIATKASWVDSGVASGTYVVTGTVATPVISPAAGTYTTAQTITLSTTTAGATIRYTTDGSTPTSSSTVYTGSFTIPLDTTQTVKAWATKTDWVDSAVASSTFVITGTVATPTFSITPGTYTSAQSVGLSTSTPGAAIHYTTDGSVPTVASPLYSSAITIPLDTTRTIKAIATKTDWADSSVLSGTFTITGTVATPTFSPVAGTYTSAQSVTVSCATAGAALYYTTDGTTPTNASTLYSTPIIIPLDTTRTLKVLAVKPSWIDSNVASATYVITGTVAAPTFAPAPGTYTTAQSVTLATATPGAAIHFTTDGSTPTAASATYSAAIPVPLDSSMTIKAIATKTDWTDSAVASATYVVTGTVDTPSFSPTPGVYTTAQDVTLSCATPGAAIFYTIDGSTPTASSTPYTGPITVPLDTTQTIKAIATKQDWTSSAVASGRFEITGTVATPTFSPSPGTFTTAQSVTLSCTTPGAAIHYTTDGSTPTAASPTFSAAIQVPLDTSKTIKAIATKANWDDSAVASGTFVVTGTVATPTFSPAAGTYATSQSITLSSATPGASLHYTTDGTTPDASSPLYTAPIVIPLDTTATVSAIAIKQDWTDSAVASATYVITGTVATPTFSLAAGTYTTARTVSLSTTTPGAVIHYTTDGSTPTAASAVFSSAIPLDLDTTTTVRAYATKTDWTDSAVASATYVITGTVAAPTFSPVAGTYPTAQDVSLSSATPGAVVHFTTDGSTPTAASPIFTSAVHIPLDTTATIRALATKTDWTDSAAVSATFVITGQVATPTFSLASGTYNTAQSVTISCTTPGAVIHYTLDGSTPDESSPVASGAITLAKGAVYAVRAGAWKTDWTPSEIASADYTVADAFSLLLVGDGVLEAGTALDLSVFGGIGPFTVDPSANVAGQGAGVSLTAPRTVTFTAPDQGAFAGTYDVFAHDPSQGLDASVTLAVPPTIELDTTSLIGGATLTAVVRGGVPGVDVTLEILDIADQLDLNGAIASTTATATPIADALDGNPAAFEISAADVLVPTVFHLRATASGQAAVSVDVTITPNARCGDGNVDAGEACDDGVNSGDPGFCDTDCSGIVPIVGDTADTGGTLDTDADTDVAVDTDDTDLADTSVDDTDVAGDTDVPADTDRPTDTDTLIYPTDTDTALGPKTGCGCDQNGGAGSLGVAVAMAMVALRRRRAARAA